jgi:adenylate cyclase
VRSARFSRSRGRSRAWLLVLAAVGAAGVGVVLVTTHAVRGQELRTVDQRFTLRGDQAAPDNIVLVAIDDATFSKFNDQHLASRWPFPRRYHAKVIDTLRRAGARAIGVDIQFTEASDAKDDNALVEAAARARGIVLATTAVRADGQTNIFGGGGILRQIGAHAGNAAVRGDAGGAIRRVPRQVQHLDTFGYALAKVANPHLQPPRQDPTWIDYAGGPGRITTVPYWKVYDNTIPAATFRDKIVIVGPTAATLQDLHTTPTSGGGFMSGAEIQASALSTFLRGGPLRQTSGTVDILLALLLGALAPLLALAAHRHKLLVRTAPIAAGALYAVAVQIAFNNGWVVPLIAPLAAVAAGYAAALAIDYMSASFERERVYDLFSRFVPDSVVKDVVARADGARLGGEQQDCTLMFTDLRGFTAFSAQHEPSVVIAVVNEYLGEMSDAILDTGGTLIAYMGDGIFAVFGAPIATDDHADRALAAARRMLDVGLPRFNDRLRAMGLPDEFRMGIGLNSGPVIVGNVGSERRLEYAAIGDSTNIAARIEAATKDTPHMLLLSDATRERLVAPPDDLIAVGELELRGAGRPIRLFSVAAGVDADQPASAAAATSPNSSPRGMSAGP